MTSGVVASDDPLAHQAYLGENQRQEFSASSTQVWSPCLICRKCRTLTRSQVWTA